MGVLEIVGKIVWGQKYSKAPARVGDRLLPVGQKKVLRREARKLATRQSVALHVFDPSFDFAFVPGHRWQGGQNEVIGGNDSDDGLIFVLRSVASDPESICFPTYHHRENLLGLNNFERLKNLKIGWVG